MDIIAYNFAALHFSDKEIACKMGISESTLNLWKKKHPTFSESIEAGKRATDDIAERSLFSRVVGYDNPNAVKMFYDRESGTVIREVYTEHYPPDVRACEFWLMNRRRKEWTNRQEIVNTNLNVDVPVSEEDKAKLKANMQAMFPGLKIA
jgi:transcriptional regulator with XRE-family HTH domain